MNNLVRILIFSVLFLSCLLKLLGQVRVSKILILCTLCKRSIESKNTCFSSCWSTPASTRFQISLHAVKLVNFLNNRNSLPVDSVLLTCWWPRQMNWCVPSESNKTKFCFLRKRSPITLVTVALLGISW